MNNKPTVFKILLSLKLFCLHDPTAAILYYYYKKKYIYYLLV